MFRSATKILLAGLMTGVLASDAQAQAHPEPADVDYGSMTLEEQLEALKHDPEVEHLRQMRQAKAHDPFRPLYHFSTPARLMNDPNGVVYWNGFYHLFYQYRAMGSGRMEWGHAFSRDLVHWQDAPLAIRQHDGGQVYSGQVLVEEDRVVASFFNTNTGIGVAIADDPLLLEFALHPDNPLVDDQTSDQDAPVFDPTIWRQEDGYCLLSGSDDAGNRRGFPTTDIYHTANKDLTGWRHVGELIAREDWIRMGLGTGDDAAVPNFHPISDDKHMFLWFSHDVGGRAMIGEYRELERRFIPEQHYLMNYGPTYKGTLHAPSAMMGPEGELLAVFNIRENKTPVRGVFGSSDPEVWYGIMTLFRHYWIGDDGTLRMEPAGDIESLRFDPQAKRDIIISDGQEHVLEGIRGRALELHATIEPGDADTVTLQVFRSPDGSEHTSIVFNTQPDDSGQQSLAIDVSQGSIYTDGVAPRSAETGPITLGEDEPLELRIFLDRSVVEVFANDRQCLTARVYPGGEESNTVSFAAEGGSATLRRLDAWQMRSIYPWLEYREGE